MLRLAGQSQVEGYTLFRSAEVASVDAEKRTVDLIFTTGFKGKRTDFWSGEEWYEELGMDPSEIRLDILNSSTAPLLNVHQRYELGDVIGVVERAWLQDGKGMATVRFSKRADVEPIFQDVKDKIIRNVSVGYKVNKWQEVSQDDDKIPTLRAVDWEPKEISLVPIGFDPGAQTRDANSPVAQRHQMEVISKRSATVPSAKPNQENQMTPEQLAAEEAKRVAAEKAQQAAVAEATRVATETERTRVSEITRLVRSVKLPDSFGEGLVKSAKTLDECRSAILDEKAKEAEAKPTSTARGIDLGEEDVQKRAAGIENALMHRIDPSKVKLEAGQRFRSMGLIELGRRHVESQGVDTSGWDKHRLAGEVLQLRSGMNSTSDFPNILAAVSNKYLLSSYDRLAARQTFRPLVRTANIPDFKTVNLVRIGEMDSLKVVPEGGEIKRGTMGDSKETYTLATYSRIFAITREAIINDDLGALTNLPSRFALAAARLESDLVWALITANGAMSDTVALFATAHANIASAAAISVTTIGAGRALMMTQKGLAGKDPLNIVPKFLVVPAALQTIADQFVSTNMLASASTSVNPFAGKLQVIAEARLDTASATKWYLAGDPADGVDVIEVGYLDGIAGPKTETKLGWEVNGVEVKATHDFGCKVIDWRGLFGNGSF